MTQFCGDKAPCTPVVLLTAMCPINSREKRGVCGWVEWGLCFCVRASVCTYYSAA